MDSRTLLDWFEFTLGPSGWAVLLVTLIVVSIPVLLHIFWFSAASTTVLPSFLLVGPSGSGKTSILTLFERGTPTATHTSQAPLSVECVLPVSTKIASNQYRSENDPGARFHRNFLLVDTPGHGKLRHFALNSIASPQNLKGIIFVVDAATMSSTSSDVGNSTLSEAAAYLYEMLMTLQRQSISANSSNGLKDIPFLIAANKMDLFTAISTKQVKSGLEKELEKIRHSRSKGLLNSDIGVDEQGEDREVLGGAGEAQFSFSLMEEYNVLIDVLPGSVLGVGAAADVDRWRNWMGSHL